MWLITPTLLNSFDYYLNYEGETTGGDEDGKPLVTAEEKEARVRADFLQTLTREKGPQTEAMLKGIEFEERIMAYCNGAPDDDPVIQAIGNIVKGGGWQQSMKRVLDDEYLLYAKADNLKRDYLYDIKFTTNAGNYEVGKYQNSAQHRIEFFCCQTIPNFSYLISDGRNWWREDYVNHHNIEQETRSLVRRFIGHLENDPGAKALYYGRWKALEAQAA